MSDTLCGPSNALQNFQKHSTADRTLQQDRLTSRNSPSQGFRSSPGPSAGLLDPEFEAFQTAQIPLQYPDTLEFHPTSFQNRYAPQQINQLSPAAWTSDFQNLNIAGPSPQYQQRSYVQQPQPQQEQFGNGWQNEFANQQGHPVGQVPSGYAGYNSLPFQRLSTIAPMAPLQAPTYSIPGIQDQIEQPQAQSTEAFDEEAFARAFSRAAKAELALGQAEQQSLGAGQDVMVNESAERLLGLEQELEPARLGADLIHDPREGESRQQQEQQNDPDALARTAGQLLDSVKDNQSDKFQKSQFLELMRQLRDREVMVEGDKIVGIQSEDRTSAGTGKGKDELEKLLSIARQLSLLDFARVEPLLAPTKPSLAPSSSAIPSSKSTQNQQLPLHSQLLLGTFIRTLTHISAALDALQAQDPGLLLRTLPFGMSIGVEVFALANSDSRIAPLLDGLPGLKALVLQFRERFEEVGIGAGMVRRLGVEKGEGIRSGMQAERKLERAGDEDEDGEWLSGWVSDWLMTLPSRQQRRTSYITSSPTESWFFSPSQLHDLLGPDLYPLSLPTTTSPPSFTATAPQARELQIQQPTPQNLRHIRTILGQDILHAMTNIWRSPQTSLFVNPLINGIDDFEEYFNDIAASRGSEVSSEEVEEEELQIEDLFPLPQLHHQHQREQSNPPLTTSTSTDQIKWGTGTYEDEVERFEALNERWLRLQSLSRGRGRGREQGMGEQMGHGYGQIHD